MVEFVGRHVEGGGAGTCLLIGVFRLRCYCLDWCTSLDCSRGICLVEDVAGLLKDGVLELLECEGVIFEAVQWELEERAVCVKMSLLIQRI